MRDQLVGYMLNALDPSEHDRIEEQLSTDHALRQELELLGTSLEPLQC